MKSHFQENEVNMTQFYQLLSESLTARNDACYSYCLKLISMFALQLLCSYVEFNVPSGKATSERFEWMKDKSIDSAGFISMFGYRQLAPGDVIKRVTP